jgi:hypothetical protein
MACISEESFHFIFGGQQISFQFGHKPLVGLIRDMARFITTPFRDVPGHRAYHQGFDFLGGLPDWLHGLQKS